MNADKNPVARPLSGKRVLVTRPPNQSADLVSRLESLGAEVLVQPAVEIRPPDDWSAVDDCLERLGTFDWLVFTSVNGVEGFFSRLRQTGRDVRTLAHLRLAAIGPATAEALRAWRLDADLVPTEYHSEGLAAALVERAAGQHILLARADRGREVLQDELAKVATVEQVTVYRQVDAGQGDPQVANALRRGAIPFVMLTSANIARAFLRSLDDASRAHVLSGVVRLVTISPVTSAAVREFSLPVAAEAQQHTTEGLLIALVESAQAGD